MTQKELLYLEDAIGHEKNILDYLNEVIGTLEEDDLIEAMEQEIETHTNMEKDLKNLLEEMAND